jgi:AAA domain-containing protein
VAVTVVALADAREGYRVEWEDAFHTILTGESYHPTLVPLAASFAAWGMPEPAADNVLRCLLINSKPADPERERRRQAELAKLPETVSSAYAKFGGSKEGEPREDGPELHWHSEEDSNVTREWLVDGLLPQTGTGLISGQWGVYKTFVGLDLAAAVMAGLAFIDYPITRRGGILFIAAEGASEIPIRLQAVLTEKYPNIKRAPFAWIDNCPRLLAPKAVDTLAAIARKAAEHMQAEFGVPLALILIDTIVDAAGYVRPGDENDAALAQRIMRCCADLSKQTDALVIGIDHFGKTVETGTRGSSAKEGRADVVPALLGDKAISGEVTNTRLAVRNNRAAASGREHPFAVRGVDLGADHNDRPLASLIVEWRSPQDTPTRPEQGDGWSKSLRLLRQTLMNTLVDQGKDTRPWADGPTVRAVSVEIVRAEFYRCYLADGDTPDAKKAARQKAFRRAVTDAQARGLIGLCNIEGEAVMWLVNPKEGPTQNA